LAQQERILNVKSVLMEKEKEAQRGRFVLLNSEVVLETFRHNKDFKEDRGIKAIEESFKGPVVPATSPKKGKKGKG
jgi:hypothetical protein